MFFETRPLFTYDSKPSYLNADHYNMISMPMASFFSNATSIENLLMDSVYIQLKDSNDHATVDAIANAFKLAHMPSNTKTYEMLEETADVNAILTKIFVAVIGITMFLSFFSLSAAMSANLYEQKKEVGILRAMGFTRYRVKALYFYEALILVFSSCALGVLIGCLVGYTMLLQQNLFLGMHLSFVFPWQEFLFIFGLSLLCAWVSTYGPATQLTNRQVAAIFRLV